MTSKRDASAAGKTLGARKTPKKAAAARQNGQSGGRPGYDIIDGTPVPYSLTVQLRGETVRRLTPTILERVARWLREHKPQMVITRSEGGYVYYELR